jgi:hypothetical protein
MVFVLHLNYIIFLIQMLKFNIKVDNIQISKARIKLKVTQYA